MRWLVVWLLLAGTYLLGWALGWLASGGPPSAEDLAHWAVVPLVQAVALAVVAAVRRRPPQ